MGNWRFYLFPGRSIIPGSEKQTSRGWKVKRHLMRDWEEIGVLGLMVACWGPAGVP